MRERRADQAMRAAVAALETAGWVRDGETRTQTVRIPTARAPVFGGIGGELRTFGGRLRMRLPDSDRRATIGPQTTCFYRIEHQPAGIGPLVPIRQRTFTSNFERVRTRDLAAVVEAAR